MKDQLFQSRLFQVTTKEIGALVRFKSEYDMEAFLKNHPLLLSLDFNAINELTEYEIKNIVDQQTIRMISKKGRIDLGVLYSKLGSYSFKIYELKNRRVTPSDISNQLKSYLENWGNDKEDQEKIKKKFKNLLTETEISKIIKERPEGILVGPSFDPATIEAANNMKNRGLSIGLIRLAKFGLDDPYVLVEDYLGETVQASRQRFTWKSKGINDGDIVSMQVNDKGRSIKISAKAYAKDKMILTQESRNIIQKREEEININIGHIDCDKTQDIVLKDLKTLNESKSGRVVSTRTAITRLAYFAFNDKNLRSYWVPDPHWYKDN
jgi:hypothetical protein